MARARGSAVLSTNSQTGLAGCIGLSLSFFVSDDDLIDPLHLAHHLAAAFFALPVPSHASTAFCFFYHPPTHAQSHRRY
jgi:hypothetical protein